MAELKPDTMGLAQKAQQKALTVVTDVYAGTLRMREEAAKYLPKFPREKRWQERADNAVLFNGLKRTVDGLAGMVMRKDVEPSDEVSDEIKADLDNIDRRGRSVDVFALDVLISEIRDGHACIFVDSPPMGEDVRTLRDEIDAGGRPYWFKVKKEQIIAARTVNIGGNPVLSHLRFRSDTTERDGEFGEKPVQRILRYDLVQAGDGTTGVQHIEYTKPEGEESWSAAPAVPLMITKDKPFPRIPLAVCHANPSRSQPLESEPPLLDLALENIRHFQLRSDRDKHLSIGSVPIPVFIGLTEEESLTVSSDEGIVLPPGGDAKVLEITGASLNASRDELRDIEQRMAALGLAMLQRDTRAAETAEARRIEANQGNASLSSAARGLESGFNQALVLHHLWLGLEPAGALSVNRDFEKQQLDAATVRVLLEAVGEGAMSLDEFWGILIRGEILTPSFDPELERARIEGDLRKTDPAREAA